jgi:hypothetical protein
MKRLVLLFVLVTVSFAAWGWDAKSMGLQLMSYLGKPLPSEAVPQSNGTFQIIETHRVGYYLEGFGFKVGKSGLVIGAVFTVFGIESERTNIINAQIELIKMIDIYGLMLTPASNSDFLIYLLGNNYMFLFSKAIAVKDGQLMYQVTVMNPRILSMLEKMPTGAVSFNPAVFTP